MKNVLNSRSARILTIVLLAQASLFYGFSRRENVPLHKPLQLFSLEDANWTLVQDVDIDKDTLDVLKADDILSRVYQNRRTGDLATLFVAYFSTQRTGKAPHSPKNCLPGSGWAPSQSGTIEIPIASASKPIRVNKYVVSRGQNQSVVFYWYQAHNRVVASEYSAKIYTIADSIRYDRSDTSLVRVVVDVSDGNIQKATAAAVSFVQAFFQPLKEYLPA